MDSTGDKWHYVQESRSGPAVPPAVQQPSAHPRRLRSRRTTAGPLAKAALNYIISYLLLDSKCRIGNNRL